MRPEAETAIRLQVVIVILPVMPCPRHKRTGFSVDHGAQYNLCDFPTA